MGSALAMGRWHRAWPGKQTLKWSYASVTGMEDTFYRGFESVFIKIGDIQITDTSVPGQDFPGYRPTRKVY